MSTDESPKLVSAAIKKLIEENEYIKHHKLNHDALLAVRKAAAEVRRVDMAELGEDKSVNVAVVYCKECGHNHQVEIAANESGAIIIDNEEQASK